ncbi:hypothetical protein DB30_00913 [Enhygromyxa salina]|uniref:Uncharacterized protein n=1 Tax=Enhygromyxa salina TaxID=215803 RepID=A0A0C2CYG4_9BACT|nr:hypothetical protein DB30_00913 [Enhygromyxa salina]
MALATALGLGLGCRQRDDASTVDPALASAATIEQVPPIPYAGTWIGPALTLSFVGPWVFVLPTHAEPGQAPIELRATVERREGDAFALRTSVAGLLPADFLRPTDWTMLVEDGQLAIAMGDEPLTAYLRDEATAPPLLGPTMLDELELPAQVSMASAVACLEQASSRCAALEAGGPLAAGCRELTWATCVAGLPPSPAADAPTDWADPTVRATWERARTIDELQLTLRYAERLDQAADPSQRSEARAVYVRTLELVATTLEALAHDGPLTDDPALTDLRAAIQTARDAGLLP